MDKTKARQTMSKVLDWIGNIWLILACVIILVGYTAIAITQGWGKLQDILSPFNIWNWLAVVITLLPGVAFKMWAKHIMKDKITNTTTLN